MSDFKVMTSAPGKVILHGEHAVVYGKAALAVSIDLRTTCTITGRRCDERDEARNSLDVSLEDFNASYSFPLGSLRGARSDCLPMEAPALTGPALSELAVRLYPDLQDKGLLSGITALLTMYLHMFAGCGDRELEPLLVEVRSKVPIGAGLGSSAAFSVSVAGALFHYLTLRPPPPPALGQSRQRCSASERLLRRAVGLPEDGSPEDPGNGPSGEAAAECISRWAFVGEKVVHGNPSGIDNSVCAFGGLLKYQTGSMERCRDLSVGLPRVLRVLLVNTKVSRNTKALVAKVREERHVPFPSVSRPIMEAIDRVSEECLVALRSLVASAAGQATPGEDLSTEDKVQEDALYHRLEQLVDINQGLLAALGVSHPELEQVRSIMDRDNFHSKLTGAGGGGFAFALVTPGHSKEQLASAKGALIGSGFDCWETAIGVEGVRLESTTHTGTFS